MDAGAGTVVDGQVVDGQVPDVIDMECTPDDCAAWAANAPMTEGVLTPFGVLDPARLSQSGRIDALLGLERLKGWADAQQARILAHAAAHPAPVPAPAAKQQQYAQLSLAEEVACALRWSAGVTRQRLHTATVLVDRLPDTLAAMECGAISYLHSRSLADAVDELPDTPTDTEDALDRAVPVALAGKLEARVLPRAPHQTLAEFRAALRRGVAALDPRGAQQQHESQAAERRVCYQPERHAMAWINSYLPAVDAQTVLTAVQAVADLTAAHTHPAGHDTGPDCGTDCARTADQRRADALTTICAAVLTGHPITGLPGPRDTGLPGPSDTGLPTWQGRRPTIHVTVALSTLLGLDEQPGHLDGYGPLPATLTRRIAADPTGTWHRLLTDPHGHLLDYGRSTYRPPQNLRDHITTRDRTCRGPGCNRPSTRSDLDHIHDWAHGGTTTPDNLHPLCQRSHYLKQHAGWDVHRHPDGTTQWTSPTGRTYHKPPDQHPIDTTRPKIDDDPPPF